MFEDSKSERIVNHLGEIIKGRYGRDLEIVRLTNLQENKSAFLTEQVGTELHVPLSHGDLFLGKAVLRGTSELSLLDIDRAAETIKLALESVLYSEYLRLLNTNQEVQVNYKDLDIRPTFLKVVEEKKTLHHSILYVEGRNQEFIRRVAQDIHEQSQSWSFVELKDLIRDFSQNLTANLKEIESLSNSTVFIGSVEAQIPEVQEWIAHLNNNDWLGDLLVLVHRNSAELTQDFKKDSSQDAIFSIDKHNGIPIISADRLPVHRLLRIESLQMMFDFPLPVSHD